MTLDVPRLLLLTDGGVAMRKATLKPSGRGLRMHQRSTPEPVAIGILTGWKMLHGHCKTTTRFALWGRLCADWLARPVAGCGSGVRSELARLMCTGRLFLSKTWRDARSATTGLSPGHVDTSDCAEGS